MSANQLEIRLRHGPPGPRVAVDLSVQAAAVGAVGGDRGMRARLLDLIAGFERPRDGLVRIGDTTVVDTEQRVWVPARRRRVGWIPAHGGLFPHLRVGENLAFAVHRFTARGRERYATLVAAFDLMGVLPLRPAEVEPREALFAATARALIAKPRLILLQEPLSGLDAAHAPDDLQDLLERVAEQGVPVLLTASEDSSLPERIRRARFADQA